LTSIGLFPSFESDLQNPSQMFLKKNILAISVLFLAITAHSQTPQVPTGNPGKPQLPVPKIKPLKPADLVVSGLTFVSITLQPDKMYLIRVIGTVRNNGELKSSKTKLGAQYATPSGNSSWKTVGESFNIAAIDPGGSTSAVWTFKGSALAIGALRFDFRLRVDADNFVAEADETNNYSIVINITPRPAH
jgi:hypothetical protein